ncbi:hypothetical protein BJF79_32295 [Actinomadura sp. CNU-125]|uniref:hypothetical protein n=1 Tax=Actinomadura sp. CNU-125 TaxID=1904961 RepID=UPI00096325ED|nr:hypothetical protein [Actinomadura sp. CNU-125]OLT35572.1 hypothetical protein BJF79_32295 [Actinomadura sp. CNU-125]
MRDLTVRLDALDPQAGAALRVIAYFDDLTAHGATLQAIVRGAAVLTAGPAALVDDARRVRIRVDAQGRAGSPRRNPRPRVAERARGSAVLWLEHPGPARIDAMVLERAPPRPPPSSTGPAAARDPTKSPRSKRSSTLRRPRRPARPRPTASGSASPHVSGPWPCTAGAH